MLKRVTFTGIDQWTKPEALSALCRDYPFVEFAMRLAESPNDSSRFPPLDMLKAYRERKFPLAVHLCGRLARHPIQTGDWSEVEEKLGSFYSLFGRMQLNTSKAGKFCREIVFPKDKQVIIQMHGGTQEFFDYYKHMPNVQGFQDDSGGGIGPENAAETVRAISKVREGDFWIDMESRIRTDECFDLSKCRAVCEQLAQAGLVTI